MIFNGIVHYVDQEVCWASKGNRIYKSNNGGDKWRNIGKLNYSFPSRLQSAHRLGRRLFRTGIHHIIPGFNNNVIVWASKNIFNIDLSTNTTISRINVMGSRPLNVCKTGSGIYYGEYRINPERSPVHIWFSDDNGSSWRPIYKFTAIRHVHGIFHDAYTGKLWITTGDENHESAIWITDNNFKTLEKVISGTQQTRCVQLLFTEQYVYFGSDAPDEKNFIYRLERKSGTIEQLQLVDGPVFWGCKVGSSLFLSTVCEPSKVNKSRYAAIWRSDDGEKWFRFMSFKKDMWSMKYFQYGQVLFPHGSGDGKNLWYTPFAIMNDQRSMKLSIY